MTDEASPKSEIEQDIDRLIFDHASEVAQKYADAEARWRLIEALRMRLVAHEMKTEDDAINVGADVAAEQLLEIARTGKHAGTFGGERMEACAQAILEIHRRADEAIARALTVQRKAEAAIKAVLEKTSAEKPARKPLEKDRTGRGGRPLKLTVWHRAMLDALRGGRMSTNELVEETKRRGAYHRLTTIDTFVTDLSKAGLVQEIETARALDKGGRMTIKVWELSAEGAALLPPKKEG